MLFFVVLFLYIFVSGNFHVINEYEITEFFDDEYINLAKQSADEDRFDAKTAELNEFKNEYLESKSKYQKLVETTKDIRMSRTEGMLERNIIGYDEYHSKFQKLQEMNDTYDHVYKSYLTNKEEKASKIVTERSKVDWYEHTKSVTSKLEEYQTIFSAKQTIFNINSPSWLNDEKYAAERNEDTKEIMKIITLGYKYIDLSLQIFYFNLQVGQTDKISSHGKIGIKYVFEENLLEMNGVFLHNGEMAHPNLHHDNEDIIVRSFRPNRFSNNDYNWLKLTDHEFETEHHTKKLPIGLYCFIREDVFNTLGYITWTMTVTPQKFTVTEGMTVTQTSQSGVGTIRTAISHANITTLVIVSEIGQVFNNVADLVIDAAASNLVIRKNDVTNIASATTCIQKNDSQFVKLEHCQIQKHELEKQELRDIVKDKSECFMEILIDNEETENNSFYDCRLTKTGIDAKGNGQSRQYISWYPEKGRQNDVFGMDHSEWTYLEDTHGIIVHGDFARELFRHELSEDTDRDVYPSRTSFHLNFSIPSIPNWDPSIKGEWRYMHYGFPLEDILGKNEDDE